MQDMETIDDSILVALTARADRTFLYSLEEEFTHLVKNAKSDECIIFPTMTSYHRLLIHKVAESFGLYSESNGWGTERQTTVTITGRASLPCLLFRDFIIYEGTPPDRTAKKAKTDTTDASNTTTTPAPTSSTTTSTTVTLTPSDFPADPSIHPSSTDSTSQTSVSSSNNNTPDNAPANSSTDLPATSPSSTPINTNTAPLATTLTTPSTSLPTDLSVNPPPAPTLTTPSTSLPTGLSANPPPAPTDPTKLKKTRKPPRTPSDGPRVMRGRGASKFLSRDEVDDFATEEVEKKDETKEKEDGELGGEKKEEDGEQKAEETRMDEEEDGMAKYTQLPLKNDYSQFEYGNPTNSKAKASSTYGFPSNEHIVQIISDLDSSPTESVEKLLAGRTKQRFTLKNKSNVYYAIFRSVAAAQALLDQADFPPEYRLSVLALTSTPKKEDFTDEGLYPRPETTVRVAQRLIGNALDMITLQRK